MPGSGGRTWEGFARRGADAWPTSGRARHSRIERPPLGCRESCAGESGRTADGPPPLSRKLVGMTENWAAAPVLLLVADTGGGHRAAAGAVAEELRGCRPGDFAPVLFDPLSGPSAAWALQRSMRLYGPAIRWAPWAWGAAYRASDSRAAFSFLRQTILRLADGPVDELISALAPAAIVSFHPLTTAAAVAAARRSPHKAPVVTVITDLATTHISWWHGGADRIVVPCADTTPRLPRRGHACGRCVNLGLPVARQFRRGAPTPAERESLRRALGLCPRRFVLVVTGGGEGAGGMRRTVSTLVSQCPEVEVVAVCGHNDRLRRTLARLARRRGGRLTVLGFVANMADWIRCADVVVTKAGPGAIAEAACSGAAMLLTGHLPGQEAGNAEFVVESGAGRHARRTEELLREVARLRDDPDALETMRAASVRLARPGAAGAIADLIAGLALPGPATRRRAVQQPSPPQGRAPGQRLGWS